MAKNLASNQGEIRKHATGLIVVLIIQYLLGMITTLFVKFPETENQGELWKFAWSQIPLALHIILGFLLLFGSLALLVRAIRAKDKVWRLSAIVGFLAIFGAAFAGSTFIPTQTDVYSLVMAICFLIALLSYGWGLYYSKS